METSLLLVGLALLGIAIGPLVAINIIANNNRKKLHKILLRFAGEHQLTLSKTEFREKRAFGLDESKAAFVLVHMPGKDQPQNELILLDEVKECRFSMVADMKDHETEGEVSDLVFSFRDPKRKQKLISFYLPAADNSIDLKPLQLTAKSWAHAINNLIKGRAPKVVSKLLQPAAATPVERFGKTG